MKNKGYDCKGSEVNYDVQATRYNAFNCILLQQLETVLPDKRKMKIILVKCGGFVKHGHR